jgi:hypothetical protein
MFYYSIAWWSFIYLYAIHCDKWPLYCSAIYKIDICLFVLFNDSQYLSVSLSLLFICLSVPFVYLSLCPFCLYDSLSLLSICLSVPFVYLSLCPFCLSVSLSLLFICLSVPFVYLSLCPFCLSVSLSSI